jgi:hypothetical protein
VIKVQEGTDGKVRSADIEFKMPGENKFRVSMRSIHNLVLVIPVEERTVEDDWEPIEWKEDDVPKPEMMKNVPPS